jgi:hypothetical protein
MDTLTAALWAINPEPPAITLALLATRPVPKIRITPRPTPCE